MVVRVQREKTQSGQKGDKRFEGEGGLESYFSRCGARLNCGDIHIQAGGV